LLAIQLRLQLADADRATAEAKTQVAAALGMPTRAVEGASISLADFEHKPSANGIGSARHDALTHRTDILAALADYAATEAALRLEIAKQYPDVHLGPGYSFDQGVNKWTVGLGFTLPVLNQNRGAIAEATAARAEAAAKFLALQAQVSAELDRAHAAFRGALEKLATADSLLASNEKQYQSAQTLLKAGESDRVAVATASLERDAAALARLDALIDAQIALGALEDAMQTPLDP
jgi:outer membrane protein TolC